MKDLGSVHYFLGIQVQISDACLFLSQQRYATNILKNTGLLDAKPLSRVSTRMVLKSAAPLNSPLFFDPTLYRQLVGSLQYLTFTRPDLSFAVNTVCQKMQSPTEHDFLQVKRILRYIKGSIELGHFISSESGLQLQAYSDSDWVGCPITRRSTSGFCTFLGENCLSWSIKKQPTVS